MPAGCAPGERRGGRAKGTPNRDRNEVRQLIEEACPGWNSLQAMALAARRGGFEKWDFVNDCPARGDDGSLIIEPISEKTRGMLLKEVNEYQYAKRKAVELTDPTGNALPSLAVSFVRSTNQDPSTEPTKDDQKGTE